MPFGCLLVAFWMPLPFASRDVPGINFREFVNFNDFWNVTGVKKSPHFDTILDMPGTWNGEHFYTTNDIFLEANDPRKVLKFNLETHTWSQFTPTEVDLQDADCFATDTEFVIYDFDDGSCSKIPLDQFQELET